MDICFEGIGQVVATFQAEDEALATGTAVKLKGSGIVEVGNENDLLCGVTVGAVRNGAVAVQIGGVVKVKYSGAEPAVGWAALACDGAGGVKTAGGAGGVTCLVLAVDKDEQTVVVKL